MRRLTADRRARRHAGTAGRYVEEPARGRGARRIGHAAFRALPAREIERQRAEEALHAAEARFETYYQATPLGIFEADGEGLCTYVSSQWEKLTGRRAAELLGAGWRKILHPDDILPAKSGVRPPWPLDPTTTNFAS